jgi:hypothetical protein
MKVAAKQVGAYCPSYMSPAARSFLNRSLHLPRNRIKHRIGLFLAENVIDAWGRDVGLRATIVTSNLTCHIARPEWTARARSCQASAEFV